jgi:hypothetical protein
MQNYILCANSHVIVNFTSSITSIYISSSTTNITFSWNLTYNHRLYFELPGVSPKYLHPQQQTPTPSHSRTRQYATMDKAMKSQPVTYVYPSPISISLLCFSSSSAGFLLLRVVFFCGKRERREQVREVEREFLWEVKRGLRVGEGGSKSVGSLTLYILLSSCLLTPDICPILNVNPSPTKNSFGVKNLLVSSSPSFEDAPTEDDGTILRAAGCAGE